MRRQVWHRGCAIDLDGTAFTNCATVSMTDEEVLYITVPGSEEPVPLWNGRVRVKVGSRWKLYPQWKNESLSDFNKRVINEINGVTTAPQCSGTSRDLFSLTDTDGFVKTPSASPVAARRSLTRERSSPNSSKPSPSSDTSAGAMPPPPPRKKQSTPSRPDEELSPTPLTEEQYLPRRSRTQQLFPTEVPDEVMPEAKGVGQVRMRDSNPRTRPL